MTRRKSCPRWSWSTCRWRCRLPSLVRLLSAIMSTASATMLAPSTAFVENVLRNFTAWPERCANAQGHAPVRCWCSPSACWFTPSPCRDSSIYEMVSGAYQVPLVGPSPRWCLACTGSVPLPRALWLPWCWAWGVAAVDFRAGLGGGLPAALAGLLAASSRHAGRLLAAAVAAQPPRCRGALPKTDPQACPARS